MQTEGADSSIGQPDEEDPDLPRATSRIAVVCLGGSAGALEPFKAFFESMPPDSGAAFVVIQHLAASHASLLTELLAQHTRMKVVQAYDGAIVEQNCVYVIPPNQDLGIRNGALFLAKPVKQAGIFMPIDFFLRSMAEDRKERAICILFSGAGSDGSLGVRAVRGAGGLTIAQDPQTAQFGDMPRSAIATGLVDYILPPQQMPETLLGYLRQPYLRRGEPAAGLGTEDKGGGLHDILAIVLAQTGCDFRCYKKGAILRRIERRMGLNRFVDIAQYSRLLGQDTGEVDQLLKDLLINVTTFFREPEAFEELRLKAIGPLVRHEQSDQPLRVWVPGCSSGEEAYSLAMLLSEEISEARTSRPLQIFATDIDEEALQAGRNGVYADSVVADVGPDRLSRFFIKKKHGNQVVDALRNSVVFALQNLITDPPFSKMDLISCRNLLIYLDVETQAKLLQLFNFALSPDGYLFLGKSEGICGRNDLFRMVSKQARLYRSCASTRPIILDSPILPGRRKTVPSAGTSTSITPTASYQDMIRHALLSRFAASVVLTDPKGRILQFHGQTGKYLDMPMTDPSLNLLDTAKEGLALKLRSAMHLAIDEARTVVLDGVPITRNEGSPSVRVTIAPIVKRGAVEPLLAVIFEDIPQPASPSTPLAQDVTREAAIRQIEDELRATQQDLQSTIEELQVSNEELRVSNEEVVSTNEELQSTIEELETSKEELQSVNEELTTVNTQLQEKVEQLNAANSDMANLLKSTQIATLFLDSELRIKFFTPATTRVLRVIPSDMGRPISDLTIDFIDYNLTTDARAVVRHGGLVEREVRHADGSRYLVRVMSYQTQQDEADGVVVTISDVTRLRQAEERTRLLATVLTDSNDAVVLSDLLGNIQAWNRGAHQMYGWTEVEALGMNVRDTVPEEESAEFSELIRRLLAGERVASFTTRRLTKAGHCIDVWLTAAPVLDESGTMWAVATTDRDITQRKQAAQALRLAKEQAEKFAEDLARSNRELEQFAYMASHDLQEPLRQVAGFTRLIKERYHGKLDDKADEFINFAVDGAERMSHLIHDLLAYSQISAQGQPLQPTSCQEALDSALISLSASIAESSAQISHDELPTLLANPTQLAQFFQNLLGNAIKFRRKGNPPVIHVGSRREEKQWILSVRDNGIGIASDDFQRIFRVFQRLHGMGKYPGTGIGLAICKKIVERHGGRIWVESEPGEGATFYFSWPDSGAADA